MTPFGLYVEIAPTMGRADLSLTVTKYAGEAEPYRDLLHFPPTEQLHIPLLARRLSKLRLRSGVVPPLINVGIQEERYFFAFSLGRLSAAPDILPLRPPVPEPYWERLRVGLEELHGCGYTYGHLGWETAAITDRGAPLLFDLTSLRTVEAQPIEVDENSLKALRERLA